MKDVISCPCFFTTSAVNPLCVEKDFQRNFLVLWRNSLKFYRRKIPSEKTRKNQWNGVRVRVQTHIETDREFHSQNTIWTLVIMEQTNSAGQNCKSLWGNEGIHCLSHGERQKTCCKRRTQKTGHWENTNTDLKRVNTDIKQAISMFAEEAEGFFFDNERGHLDKLIDVTKSEWSSKLGPFELLCLINLYSALSTSLTDMQIWIYFQEIVATFILNLSLGRTHLCRV